MAGIPAENFAPVQKKRTEFKKHRRNQAMFFDLWGALFDLFLQQLDQSVQERRRDLVGHLAYGLRGRG